MRALLFPSNNFDTSEDKVVHMARSILKQARDNFNKLVSKKIPKRTWCCKVCFRSFVGTEYVMVWKKQTQGRVCLECISKNPDLIGKKYEK